MDFPIGNILETLFAGCLASFTVIILTFLLTAFYPSEYLGFWLQKMFYRRSSNSTITVNDVVKSSFMGDFSKWFFGLIMVSVIYSFGVTIEHLSDKWTDNSRQFIFWIHFPPIPGDKIIRAKAFKRVNPNMPEKEVNLSKEVEKHLEESDIEECEALVKRIDMRYYRAKNRVYRNNNYFTELQGIQRRIDFMRALMFTSIASIISILIGLILSLIPHLTSKNFGSRNPFIQHCKKLHKIQLIILFVIMTVFWFLTSFTWEHEEEQFDLRVFGYYNSLTNLQTIDDVALSNSDAKIDYSTFGKGKYRKFEPSGVSKIGKTNSFIIINDKNEEPPFSIFQWTGEGQLKEVSQFALKTKDRQVDVFKLEAITASRKDPGTFYVITSFDRNEPGYRKLIRFKLDKTNELINFEELNLYDPRKIITLKLKKEWSAIEALALSPEEEYLFIGVRAIGENYETPSYKVIILKYAINDLDKEPEILVSVDLQGYLGRPEGISSLEYSSELNKFLLLTSFEVGDDITTIKKDQVGGHLWIVPEELSKLNSLDQWKEFKRLTFTHKPEGVEVLSASKAIVVFDDDNDRKSITGDESKFKLAPNEAVFCTTNLSQ